MLNEGRRSLGGLALAIDARLLASVGGNEARLWDLRTRSETLLKGHGDMVMCATFSPAGRLLATGSHDRTVKLWDVRDRKAIATLTNQFPVGSLAFSPDGRTLIAAGSKNSFLLDNVAGLQFWDVNSRQATGTVPGDSSDIVQVAWSYDGELIATSHLDGPVSLWDAQTRRLVHRFKSQFGSLVITLAFSPTEPLLAGSDSVGNIVLYNTRSLDVVPPPLKAHSGRLMSLAFTPDGRTLASAGEGGGLKLWHVATHRMTLTLKGHIGAVTGIAFAQNGAFMASCGVDGTVRIWPADAAEAGAMDQQDLQIQR